MSKQKAETETANDEPKKPLKRKPKPKIQDEKKDFEMIKASVLSEFEIRKEEECYVHVYLTDTSLHRVENGRKFYAKKMKKISEQNFMFMFGNQFFNDGAWSRDEIRTPADIYDNWANLTIEDFVYRVEGKYMTATEKMSQRAKDDFYKIRFSEFKAKLLCDGATTHFIEAGDIIHVPEFETKID